MKISLLIFILLFSSQVFSTPQIPDTLVYDGKKYDFDLDYFSPAHKYFHKNDFVAPKESVITTANYYPFIFTYEIINSNLYLTDVNIYVKGKNTYLQVKSVFKDYFPNYDKILMNVNQIVIIPNGEIISTDTNGWSDSYNSKYLIFQFTKGKVTKSLNLTHEEYLNECKNQFQDYKTTREFKSLIKSAKFNEELNIHNKIYPFELNLTAKQYMEKRIFYYLDHIR